MVKMELDLEECEMKKKSLANMYETLNSQASSILVFTLQWKELEERLDSISKELHEKEQTLNAKELVFESKAKEQQLMFDAKVKELGEKQLEIEDAKSFLLSKVRSRIKEEGLRYKSMEEMRCDLEIRERELQEREEKVSTDERELDSLNYRTKEMYEMLVKEAQEDLQQKQRQLEESHQEREKMLENKVKQLEESHRELEKKLETKDRQLQYVVKKHEAVEMRLKVSSYERKTDTNLIF